jgi:hypothetical protein
VTLDILTSSTQFPAIPRPVVTTSRERQMRTTGSRPPQGLGLPAGYPPE